MFSTLQVQVYPKKKNVWYVETETTGFGKVNNHNWFANILKVRCVQSTGQF